MCSPFYSYFRNHGRGTGNIHLVKIQWPTLLPEGSADAVTWAPWHHFPSSLPAQTVQFNILVVLSSLLAAAMPLRVAGPAQTLLQTRTKFPFFLPRWNSTRRCGVFICWRGVVNTVEKLSAVRRQQDEGGFRHRMKIVKLALILPLPFQGREGVR